MWEKYGSAYRYGTVRYPKKPPILNTVMRMQKTDLTSKPIIRYRLSTGDCTDY